jgi:chlorobactene glucosyltransferase
VQLLLSFGVLAIVAWLILRAVHQRALLPPLAPAAPPAAGKTPDVAVIVPARDEAANIVRCLQALLAQTHPAEHLRILVVDDHSSDATAALAHALAAAHRQIEVLASPPLPQGWTGKSHACWIGAGAAPPAAEWLCFLDADVRAEPALLASAVPAARSDALDLLSLAPRQELGSFAERLIMPCGLYLLAFCQDLRKLQSRRGADVTATGQFMLIRRRAYHAVGGHAAVRHEICEDLALARLLKRAGHNVLLCDGSQLLSTRMYTGWDTLWPGIAKNLVEMLGGALPTIVTALAAVALAWALWLIPLADGLSCARGSSQGCIALMPALAAAFAAFGLHLAGAAHFRIPLWYGFLFPLGYTAGALMAADSVRWRWRRRVGWKGRVYS